MELKDRCATFLSEFGIPISAFCKRIMLSQSAYSQWRRGDLKLADTTLERIDNYLAKYGF